MIKIFFQVEITFPFKLNTFFRPFPLLDAALANDYTEGPVPGVQGFQNSKTMNTKTSLSFHLGIRQEFSGDGGVSQAPNSTFQSEHPRAWNTKQTQKPGCARN